MRHKAISEEKRSRIRKLILQGLSLAIIELRCGVSRTTILAVAREHGLSVSRGERGEV